MAAPLIMAGLALLPKIPAMWDAIASLFGKKVPDSVEAAGKLAGEIVGELEKGNVPIEQQIQLKTIMYAHEAAIMEHQRKEQEMYLADRQDARKMSVENTKATGKRDTNLYVLAWVNVVGFFAIIAAVILADMPTNEVAKTALAMLFGALIGGYKDVQGYFFGSSKGSADKNELLANGKKP